MPPSRLRIRKSFFPAICRPRLRRGRVIVLAGGKAGASMAVAAERHYLDTLGLAVDRLVGIAITRPGYAKATAIIPVIEAGHPVPDAAGLEATARLLALADGATAEDLVLVLLSGGASAAWVAPAGRLTLSEYQAVTRALLRSGATIGEVNTVRKRLSRVQGALGRAGRAGLACDARHIGCPGRRSFDDRVWPHRSGSDHA